MVYKYMGPTVVVHRVQQKSTGYWWPSDLTVPREATATTIRCYVMSMTGNAYYCSVPLISPRSRPALSLRRFGEETNLQFLGFLIWESDTTGYTLVEKRLSWVHTVQQREINSYDWSTPTLYPAAS